MPPLVSVPTTEIRAVPGAPAAIVNVTRYSPDDRSVPVFVTADAPSCVSEMRGAARSGSTGDGDGQLLAGTPPARREQRAERIDQVFWFTTVVPIVLVAVSRRVYEPRDT